MDPDYYLDPDDPVDTPEEEPTTLFNVFGKIFDDLVHGTGLEALKPGDRDYVSLKDIFEKECGHIKIDQKKAREVASYVLNFANRNEDHVAFFGGNLMGVQRVRFLQEDRNHWMDDIVEGDDHALKDMILEATDVQANWIVSTDAFNQSCTWLAHKFLTSSLPDKVKEQAAINCMLALQYRFITSILSYWFKYQANHDVAVATYARLSLKFGLKRHGTWGKLLEYRAQEIVSKRSIWYNTLISYDNNTDIVNMVNDIQGRIKDILKNIRDVFEDVLHSPDMLISNTSATGTNIDGETVVRDVFSNEQKMKRYIHTVVLDSDSFFKENLYQIVLDAMPRVHERLFRELLGYMSRNAGRGGDPNIAPFVEGVLDHMFGVYHGLRGPERRRNNISGMLARLRGLYTASKSNDVNLSTVKDLGEQIANYGVRTKNATMIAALRTSTMLYVALRAMTMDHYT